MPRTKEITTRIAQIKDQLEAQKPLYEELDNLTLELHEILGDGGFKYPTNEEIPRFVSVIDNFSEKNTVFRPASVKRFEAILQTAEEVEKEKAKLEKAAKKASKLSSGDASV